MFKRFDVNKSMNGIRMFKHLWAIWPNSLVCLKHKCSRVQSILYSIILFALLFALSLGPFHFYIFSSIQLNSKRIWPFWWLMQNWDRLKVIPFLMPDREREHIPNIFFGLWFNSMQTNITVDTITVCKVTRFFSHSAYHTTFYCSIYFMLGNIGSKLKKLIKLLK